MKKEERGKQLTKQSNTAHVHMPNIVAMSTELVDNIPGTILLNR